MIDWDWQWGLLALPLAFGLGWIASRVDLRQWRAQQGSAPSGAHQGLLLLLNDQHDAAIDTFIEALRRDPDSAELHFALGQLFRRRGEYERSVRVHEHLLQRADLSAEQRHRAQRALALDYLQAGLFDRAESAWRALEGSPHDQQARLAQLKLAERTRDWARALELGDSLPEALRQELAPQRAHHACERAAQAFAQGQDEIATQALAQARAADPQALRPTWDLARWHLRQGQASQALDLLLHLLRPPHHPQATWVLADAGQAASQCQREAEYREALWALYQAQATPSTLRAWLHSAASQAGAQAGAGPGADGPWAQSQWLQHLQQHPSLEAAAQCLALPQADLNQPQARQALSAALTQALAPLSRQRCGVCGFEADNHFWQCPGCLSWDSLLPPREGATGATTVR